jgi:hypothetical protein
VTSCASPKGYFSSNIESIRKDVECTFGILKKRCHVLDHGFIYHNIMICKKVFITFCDFHTFLLDLMERTNVCVGCGYSIGDYGLWLVGHMNNIDACLRLLSIQFELRRYKLAKH